MQATSDDITRWLLDWSEGDREALEQLLPRVYDELHRQAASYMRRERAEHTLQPTALVHEAYLRLIDQGRVRWQNRAQFFGVAAQMMRRILVDHARSRLLAKRGGGAPRVQLDERLVAADGRHPQLVELDQALEALATVDPRLARVVELRVFGGLTIQETAEVMTVSPGTVINSYRLARAWLFRELQGGR